MNSKSDRAIENQQFARRGQLHYVNYEDFNIQRIRSKKSFSYRTARQGNLKGQRVIQRIEKLAIPPAWTEVWICQDPQGHIQAVGKDAKGRKQYRYHARWSELRNENKFDRMVDFGRVLPRIRRTISRDLRATELNRKKVLAALVRLLELSAARVGNESYVSQNRSYGLTTLRNHHARVIGDKIKFRFRGKGGKAHEFDIEHPTVARVIRKCQNLRGQKLFEYVSDKGVQVIASDDVNEYIGEIAGENFTAKDFRTWKATTLAMGTLSRGRCTSPAAKQKAVTQAIQEAAAHLGNTPAICKKSYIHPTILDAFLNDGLKMPKTSLKNGSRASGLSQAEKAVMRALREAKG